MKLKVAAYNPGITADITADAHGLNSDESVRAENERLKSQLKRLRRYVGELEQAADTDPLIPVYNRRAFMRELGRAQSVLDRYGIPSCVIFLDLNDFKSVNDKYGHAIGDEMLKQVGLTLKGGVRECDMVARLGGDEFGILLFKTPLKQAQAKAAALSCRIADIEIDMPTETIGVTASWGASFCDAVETAESVLSRADRNMYAAKSYNL